ncbi:MAG: hypothetical protein SPL05_08240 [Eubacteriales bacterium]|nr:hypothetical protein [Eubacteriales bacterium]
MKHKGLLFFGVIAVCVIVVVIIGLGRYSNLRTFKDAEAQMSKKNFAKAVEEFTALGTFMDADQKIAEVYYAEGKHLLSKKEFDAAVVAYQNAGEYKDAAKKITEVLYAKAKQLEKDGQFEKASAEYSALGDYKDAAQKAMENQYLLAEQHFNNSEFAKAKSILEGIPSYEASAALMDTVVKEEQYATAALLVADSKFLEAANTFEALGEYKDAKVQSVNALLAACKKLVEENKLVDAKAMLEKLAGNEEAKAILDNILQKELNNTPSVSPAP